MASWKSQIEPDDPCWEGYRGYLEVLDGQAFPDSERLNKLLPPRTMNRDGRSIRFVPATELPGLDYERQIFETGRVSTRENNWHDLFNALVWCRLPELKATINSLHFEHLADDREGRRGKLRDALTLLDESGVIVSGSDIDALDALARRDWNGAFVTHRESWGTQLQVLVCGHAILEKCIQPYKAITAHALLIHTPSTYSAEDLDQLLGSSLAKRRWLQSPAGLSPLPLAGIPGWWASCVQDDVFYQDHAVFRPPAPGRPLAPVHRIEAA